jgi:hypothetical protein
VVISPGAGTSTRLIRKHDDLDFLADGLAARFQSECLISHSANGYYSGMAVASATVFDYSANGQLWKENKVVD